ncbi:AAA family ATPase [Mucilaginibacter celer]|uniref:Cytidyltransferase n=1 Tax=Mucilaginibacter celer TaxID=2305508 RepID=A0A494VX44_9SPHI|nr:AAA family ATPase [Mucilaginibacter celer]AYL95815.1 cytidyltransferase [Mucilaginibacter celer]
MTNGFVFGKFLPFHKGHEALIRFALSKCDFVTVLICCSDKEVLPGDVRQRWIGESFAGIHQLEIRIFNYLESELPNTSQSSRKVSAVWARQFKTLLPGYTVVITSEPYGAFVAGFMNIKHIPFDPDRSRFSISASAIRSDLFSNWNFLPAAVKPFYAIKIAILGTESVGKSTLSEQLAEHYNSSLVPEAGRDLIADSNSFTYNDLLRVSHEHSKRVKATMAGDNPLIIMDTDLHITMSYSRFVFDKELELTDEISSVDKSHLYLYLVNDVPHVQDGTRLDLERRNALDASHRRVLFDNNIPFIELKGSWEERFTAALRNIDHLIAQK